MNIGRARREREFDTYRAAGAFHKTPIPTFDDPMQKHSRTQRTIIILFAGLLLMTGPSGCKNTAHGAGEDIEKMGEKIQEKTN